MIEYWDAFVKYIWDVCLSVFGFFKDMFWWVLDTIFSIGQTMLGSVSNGLSNLNPLMYFDSIPSSTKWFMNAVGFNESMGIIITAITIRFLMQAIPFVRWGS
ncbi:MAG: hypothetical protein COB45_08410 [Gammaproteobacteria bacterium]|nr:DUF2523 domain-containing protein [Pseudomonas sp.]PCI54392.1 MAG: hypothetical protein COB45_08410 [Gammaproteobacteria bacterium]